MRLVLHYAASVGCRRPRTDLPCERLEPESGNTRTWGLPQTPAEAPKGFRLLGKTYCALAPMTNRHCSDGAKKKKAVKAIGMGAGDF